MKGKGQLGGLIGLDVEGRTCREDDVCNFEGMEVS